ncbi:MAG: hypothetical protein GY778_22440 [bacterium]|nr:hypothetical protein [bacterium]
MTVALVVLAVVLGGPMERLGLWRSAGGDDAADATSARGGSEEPTALEALHASEQVERDRLIAQIQNEFGAVVEAERFASHHAVRDYLERLRLARRAGELGVEIDPESFGDDEFMRRYLAERVPGGAEALAVADHPAAGPGPMTPPVRAGLDRSEYVFINGRRYYPNGRGAYVDKTGAVLLTSPYQTPRRRAAQDAAEPTGQQGLPGLDADMLGNLDTLLEMLLPPGGDE